MAKALCRSVRAALTAGQAATREAPAPACSVRILRVTSWPSSSTCSSPAPTEPNSTRMERATRDVLLDIVGIEIPLRCRPAPPAGTARRCRAGASRRATATMRLMVPLPELEGPSMVTMGTECLSAH